MIQVCSGAGDPLEGSATKNRLALRDLLPWSVGARALLSVLVLALGLTLRFAGQVGGVAPLSHRRIAPMLVINPNTVPGTVLGALPHVGPALKGRILAERAASPFGSKAELGRRVKGLGPITMARLEPHLRLDPGTIGQKPARRGSLK